jgi:cytoskeletal protein CcmA (bactofilin family)
MWKRDEAVRPPTGQPNGPAAPAAAPLPPATPGTTGHRPHVEALSQIERDKVNIGKSVVIKGELNGSEDLTIEGHVEGKIELREHVLTIGPNGKINAQVFAKSVIVLGEVTGNVTATEKVDIRDNGSVDGDIIAPRVAIAEGAHFRGSVDMQRATRPAQPGAPQPTASQVQAVKSDTGVKPVQQQPAAAPQGQQPGPQRVGV